MVVGGGEILHDSSSSARLMLAEARNGFLTLGGWGVEVRDVFTALPLVRFDTSRLKGY